MKKKSREEADDLTICFPHASDYGATGFLFVTTITLTSTSYLAYPRLTMAMLNVVYAREGSISILLDIGGARLIGD